MENNKKGRFSILKIPDYKDLPKWKIPFKIFGRIIMFLLFLVCGVGLPVAVAIFWEDIVYQGTYDFFGVQLSTIVIAIIALSILVPIGIYGLIVSVKMIITDLQMKKFRLTLAPKIGAITIIILSISAVLYYTPGWYLYLGINPKWGPYIAFHGDDGMQISWDTRSKTESKIVYGTDPNNLDLEATGGEYFWETGEKSLHHCVAITGLTSNQKYYYKIPGFDNNLYYFTTAPSPTSGEEVSFTILGDTQGNLNIQKQNIGCMNAKFGIEGLNFTVVCGDNVNDDDNIAEWDMLFNKQSYGKIAPYVPYHVSSGNHECGTMNDDPDYPPRQNLKLFHQNKFLKTREIEPGDWDIGYYYSFNYSNVHMVILDNFNSNEELSDGQVDWLIQDLERNSDNWKFLCFHHSMYSSSDHGSYPDLAEILEPIMHEQQIHAIFYGHDHIYEYYEVNGTEPHKTYCFLCAGGGGSLKQVTNPEKMGERVWPTEQSYVNEWGNYVLEIGSWTTDDRFETQYGWEWQVYAERTHHYMQVSVDGNVATFNAYRTVDNSLIKSYSYVKT
ncbi:MAG: hypothetical protein GF364_15985 [Candidatus Lokiarchaeota archaeon]|nr:hypothetical protein [Candidatus Lokiarchaeota archaeon]